MQPGEQEAGVAVAHVVLPRAAVGQIGQRVFGDAVGPITATREPDGVDRRVGHHLAQGREPRRVRPREMAVGEETLRMDDQFAIAAVGARSPATAAAASRFNGQLGATTAIRILASLLPILLARPLPANRGLAMNPHPFSSAASAAAACSLSPRSSAPAGAGSPAPTARSTPGARRTSSIICARSESSCSRRTDRASADGMTLVTSAAVEATVPDVVRATRARPRTSHPPAIPRPAAQRRAAQRRRRRHQRQVDRHRDDRLDPPRLPPPADGDERRGDEEFRDPLGALRQRAGRRPRTVRQRGRRKRRLDRALPARDRGADQHQPRP